MIELKVQDLKVSDEFTADDGETWWKLRSIEPRKFNVRLVIECVQTQRVDTPLGELGVSIRCNDDLVIVR